MSVRRQRRIAVVTGTRAEYGLLRSTMRAIDDHSRLSLRVIVAGMHLLRSFGRTADQVTKDGFPVHARVRMQRGDDDPLDQARGLGRGVSGMAEALAESGAEIVVVLGDRIEAMAGALAGVTTGRLVAHIHGGDVAPGDFDDSLRHAITKLAHVHCAATRDAAKRIIRMGESSDRVHVVGAPGLDELFERKARRSGARDERAIVLFHASGRSARQERAVMTRILAAVDRARLRPTIIYPNSDRGHSGVLEAIDAYCGRRAGTDVRRSMPRDEFLDTLLESAVMIGNSSAGLIEAPAAGTPSVNVGPRQRGRMPGGPTVIESDETRDAIADALARALASASPRAVGRRRASGIGHSRPTADRVSPYGDGSAGKRIAALLARPHILRLGGGKLITY